MPSREAALQSAEMVAMPAAANNCGRLPSLTDNRSWQAPGQRRSQVVAGQRLSLPKLLARVSSRDACRLTGRHAAMLLG
jgi:hypothetical protein